MGQARRHLKGGGWSKRIDVYILPVRPTNPERMDTARQPINRGYLLQPKPSGEHSQSKRQNENSMQHWDKGDQLGG